jgi:Thioredoxin
VSRYERTQTRAREAGRNARSRTGLGPVPWIRTLKWRQICIGLLVLSFAVCVGILLLRGRDGIDPTRSSDSGAHAAVSTLLHGIPQHGVTLGDPTAPITLVVFGDLECASVRDFFREDLPGIVRKLVRPGLVKITYRAFQTDTLKRQVFVQQQSAALAAGEQGRFWDFISTFYFEQRREYSNYVTMSFLRGIAVQILGLMTQRWESHMMDTAWFDKLARDNAAFRGRRFHTTPSFLIGASGGSLHRLVGYAPRRSARTYHGYWISIVDANELERATRGLLCPSVLESAFCRGPS